MQKALLTTTSEALDFIRGGNKNGKATFTVVSKETGTRFTFKAQQPSEETPVFIKLLTGPENTSDFSIFGTLFSNGDFYRNKKARVSENAPSVRAFDWLAKVLKRGSEKAFAKCEFWHEGRCGCCGRPLTNPESIDRGIGPKCAAGMGL